MLYSISSDLWQPLGYVHMLERRGLYLSLVHDQYLVDFLSEEDVEAGRLDEYGVLYTADPCIRDLAVARSPTGCSRGGRSFGSAAAGSRNEFNEPVEGLAKVFGIAGRITTTLQPGRYHIRGALNDLPYLDRISAGTDRQIELGAIGAKVAIQPTAGQVVGKFQDGSPAIIEHPFGQGRATYVAACPAIAYVKEAKFVPDALREKWPAEIRRQINRTAEQGGAERLVELSHAVVEAGVYDAPTGTALVLGNFTYEPIPALKIRLPRTATRSASPVTGAGALAVRDGRHVRGRNRCPRRCLRAFPRHQRHRAVRVRMSEPKDLPRVTEIGSFNRDPTGSVPRTRSPLGRG